jgi:hypothetical protein
MTMADNCHGFVTDWPSPAGASLLAHYPTAGCYRCHASGLTATSEILARRVGLAFDEVT